MPKHHTDTARAEQAEVQYRDVPGFPGYRVGNDGSVWSCCRKTGRGTGLGFKWAISDTCHRLKTFVRRKGGYLVVGLSRDGRNFGRPIHRLVLEAFVGPRPGGLECRHLDGNPKNNHLGNLCWGTPLENAADTIRHGRRPKTSGPKDGVVCINGHEQSEENVYRYQRGPRKGRIVCCRICRRERDRASRRRQRGIPATGD